MDIDEWLRIHLRSLKLAELKQLYHTQHLTVPPNVRAKKQLIKHMTEDSPPEVKQLFKVHVEQLRGLHTNERSNTTIECQLYQLSRETIIDVLKKNKVNQRNNLTRRRLRMPAPTIPTSLFTQFL